MKISPISKNLNGDKKLFEVPTIKEALKRVNYIFDNGIFGNVRATKLSNHPRFSNSSVLFNPRNKK